MKKYWYNYLATCILMIVFTMVELVVNNLFPSLFHCFNMNSNVLMSGEWWRTVTSGLMHFGWIHLLGNLYGTYAIGITFEKKAGSLLFVLCFLSGNIVARLLSVFFFTFSSAVGASPGIYSCIAYSLVFFIANKQYIRNAPGKFMLWGIGVYLTLGNFIGFSLKHLLVFSPHRLFVHGVGFLIGLIFGVSHFIITKSKQKACETANKYGCF